MKKISILGVLIGFMLKVIKTNQKIDQKFNSLFIELRHGNYDNFLNLANSYGIAQHPPYMVIYNDGDNFSVGGCLRCRIANRQN